MNFESVVRIVALNRRIASYKAMVKQGVLTQEEAELMIAKCNQEIAAARSQDDLQLSGDAGKTPSKGAKGV